MMLTRTERGSAIIAALVIALLSLVIITRLSTAVLRTAVRLSAQRMALDRTSAERQQLADALSLFFTAGSPPEGSRVSTLAASPALLELRAADPENNRSLLVATASRGIRRPSWLTLRSLTVPETRCRWEESSGASAPASERAAVSALSSRTCTLDSLTLNRSTYFPGNLFTARDLVIVPGEERIFIAAAGAIAIGGALRIEPPGNVEVIAAGPLSLQNISASAGTLRLASITGEVVIADPAAAPIFARECAPDALNAAAEAAQGIRIGPEPLSQTARAGCALPYPPSVWPPLKILGDYTTE